MKNSFILFLLCSFFSSACNAQTLPVYSSSETGLLLKKLGQTGSVLYFAAHPDDENNRLLSFLGKGRTLRTAYLSLNRGEGGQNLIGNEQGDALGLIRTEELLGARSVDGAEQFFTRAYDFGYSKSPEETLHIWNRDSVLSDAVWVIRSFRPDVIIDRFPTTGEGGHGHHTASAILSIDAMLAAADPSRFPEQLRWVKPWKVKRLLWNTFNFGSIDTRRPDQFSMAVGDYSSLLGKSFGELAAESRSFHKSQGFGSEAARGKQSEFFKLIKGDALEKDLLDGVDTTWARIPGSANSASFVRQAIASYEPKHPEKILPALLQAYKSIDEVSDPFWKDLKKKELGTLIRACSGIWISATTDQREWSERSTVSVSLNIIRRGQFPLQLGKITLNSQQVSSSADLPFNTMVRYHSSIQATEAMLSQPYWLKYPHESWGYTWKGNRLWNGLPENPEPIAAFFYLESEGVTVKLSVPVFYHAVDPAKGEVYEPLRILPPLSIRPKDQVLIFSSHSPKTISVELKANEDKMEGLLEAELPAGYTASPASIPYKLALKGEKITVSFILNPPAVFKDEKGDSIRFKAKTGDIMNNQTVNDIEYSHIPHITWLTPAVTKVLSPKMAIPKGKLAYIDGAGDQVPALLSQLGYQVYLLSDQQLAEEDLSQYKAIITGVRAFNVRNALKYNHEKLLAYMRGGGCLIEQYNRPNDLVTDDFGPYPFSIGGQRITDENATVTFTDKNSRILNYPNQIGAADFEGWLQERATYLPTTADSRYQTPISMHDPGESDLKNALLYCPYGKGAFVYASLVFFRELPAGVPGAIRLFVNLIDAAGLKAEGVKNEVVPALIKKGPSHLNQIMKKDKP